MKHRFLLNLAASGVLLCIATSANADTPDAIRPVESAYTLSVGQGKLADTYLTPLRYSGVALSLDYERQQAMKFDPDAWAMRLAVGAEGMRTTNAAGNSTMWSAMIHASWGMLRKFELPCAIKVGVGGSVSLDAGCLYNRRNSNNPASAKCALTLNLTGYARKNFKVGRLPLTLTYRPTIPVVGAFFSPEYGELYYEIYMGDRSGLVHPAWWGNYFAMENLLTLDMQLGSTALRVGMRSNLLTSSVNNLATRILSTQAVVGISGEWLSLNPEKHLSHKDLSIISAY